VNTKKFAMREYLPRIDNSGDYYDNHHIDFSFEKEPERLYFSWFCIREIIPFSGVSMPNILDK
jgi:hypothetical protein